MVSILAYQNGKVRQLTIQELFRMRCEPMPDDMVVWVDMNNPTEQEEETILIHYYLFHHLAVEDCQRERIEPDEGDHYPKVEDYKDYLFVIFNPVDQPVESVASIWEGEDSEEDKLISIRFPTRQINAFLGKQFLVTHHYEHSASIEATQRLCMRSAHTLERGPDYLFHVIIDQIVDNYVPLMDYFDDLISRMEVTIFRQQHPAMLSRLLSMKKGIQQLRKIAGYQREILNRLARGEFSIISSEEMAYYRNVYDHLVRIVDLSETYRDLINGLMDAYLSVTSNKLNEIMKVLTMLSTVIMPLTLITGIYGMNFHHMPELQWKYGYLLVWGAFAFVSGGMIYFFKRRGWI